LFTSLTAAFIFAPEIFILDVWYEKQAPKTGARKCSRFMAPVSGAYVMGIRCTL